MRILPSLRLPLLAIIAGCLPLAAQAQENPGVTVNAGVGQYWFGAKGLDDDTAMSAGVGYRFDNPFAVEVAYGSADTAIGPVSADLTQYRLDGLYHFSETERFSPFLSFGAGKGEVEVAGLSADETQLNLGAGFKYFFNEHLAFRSDLKWFRDNSENDMALLVGLHLNLGGQAAMAAPVRTDADGDGVYDDADQCPGTARGMKVDSVGCYLDGDKDGVVDGTDQCPTTPAGAPVDRRGCAVDSDRDGVKDFADSCPKTPPPGKVDGKGCYLQIDEPIRITLNIEFDFDSSDARVDHRPEAAKVAKALNDYPLTRVTIEGHTDSLGNDEYNRQLSESRATTIAELLVNEFGIDPTRVDQMGYGETRPIADNNTETGRQRNRRVVANIEGTKRSIVPR